MEWTSDQILNLAPDGGSARSGRELARPAPWSGLGNDNRACWGLCKGSGAKPYQTQIDLAEPAFKCSCPSRKFPCKHGIGLFLLLVEQRGLFPAGAARPDWVEEWLIGRDRKAKPKDGGGESKAPGGARAGGVADPTAQARRAADREAKVAAGLDELGRWILDLVRQGLASAQGKPYSFWEGMAARMVDAQAPGAARMVRDLAGIPASGEGWPERLLERLGRLLLLIEGHARLAELPESTRADVRSLVGWALDQKELLEQPGLRDHWAVLGRRIELEDRIKVQRTWLLGRDAGRSALVLSFAAPGQNLDTRLVPGTVVDAELVFFPGAWPIRALMKERHGIPDSIAGSSVPAHASLGAAVAAFGSAVAADPWLERFPMALGGVIPVVRGDDWSVRDPEGRALPLAVRGDQGWRVLAGSGGRAVGLFGEYDGTTIRPLSVWNERGFQQIPGDEVG